MKKQYLICSATHHDKDGPQESRIAKVGREMGLEVVDLLPYVVDNQPINPVIRSAIEDSFREGLEPILAAPSNLEQAAWGVFLKTSGIKTYRIATIPNDNKPGGESRIKAHLLAAIEGRPSPVVEEVALSIEFKEFENMVVEEVTWLVPHLVPRGRYTLLAGSGGIGKSSFTVALSAALTRGLYGSPARCLVINLEDDPASVTLPRLHAGGANLRLVQCLTMSRGFSLDQIEEVRVLLNREKAAGRPFGLVVVDPVGRLIKGGSTKDDGLIWAMADALDRMARETDAAVVACAHPRKGARAGGTVRRDAEAVSGSAALVNSTRSTLLMVALNDGRRFVGQVKSNYGRPHYIEVRARAPYPKEQDAIDQADPKAAAAMEAVSAQVLEWTAPKPIPVGKDFEDLLQGFEEEVVADDSLLPLPALVDAVVDALKVCPMPREEIKLALCEHAPKPDAVLAQLKARGVRWKKESSGVQGGGPWWLWVPGGRPFVLMTDEERNQARAFETVAKVLGDAVGRKRENLDQADNQVVEAGWHSAWSVINEVNASPLLKIVAK